MRTLLCPRHKPSLERLPYNSHLGKIILLKFPRNLDENTNISWWAV